MPKTPKIQDKNVPIPNYTIPQIKSKDDSGCRTIERKAIQNVSREMPIYPDPVYRPPPKPLKSSIPKIPRSLLDIDPDLNTNFEKKSTFSRLEKSHFQEPQELESLINTGMLVQKFFPKQIDIDIILKIIQRKVLKGMHLPVTVNEIQAGYLISPYVMDLYVFLAQNKWPNMKT